MSQRSSGLDGFKGVSGVNYSAVSDKPHEDKRYLREKQTPVVSSTAVSSTFSAFQRMAAGLEGRKIADKIADPNRPTWEQYKRENEDKLDLVGADVRKMVEYRAELDKERDRKLKRLSASESDHHHNKKDSKRRKKSSHRRHDSDNSDNDDSDDESTSSFSSSSSSSSSSTSSSREHKKSSKKKSSKKHSHKHKKSKKSSKKHSKHSKRRDEDSDNSDNDNNNDNKDNKDEDKDNRKQRFEDNDAPMRLSDYLRS